MNVQIFGKTNCQASRGCERFFKERKIRYQFINLKEKSLSPRELDSVVAKVKDINILIDELSPIYSQQNVSQLRSVDGKKKVILAYPQILVTPIVRDCDSGLCSVGKAEDMWKEWAKTK